MISYWRAVECRIFKWLVENAGNDVRRYLHFFILFMYIKVSYVLLILSKCSSDCISCFSFKRVEISNSALVSCLIISLKVYHVISSQSNLKSLIIKISNVFCAKLRVYFLLLFLSRLFPYWQPSKVWENGLCHCPGIRE